MVFLMLVILGFLILDDIVKKIMNCKTDHIAFVLFRCTFEKMGDVFRAHEFFNFFFM
jgi:hypothetical protein